VPEHHFRIAGSGQVEPGAQRERAVGFVEVVAARAVGPELRATVGGYRLVGGLVGIVVRPIDNGPRSVRNPIGAAHFQVVTPVGRDDRIGFVAQGKIVDPPAIIDLPGTARIQPEAQMDHASEIVRQREDDLCPTGVCRSIGQIRAG